MSVCFVLFTDDRVFKKEIKRFCGGGRRELPQSPAFFVYADVERRSSPNNRTVPREIIMRRKLRIASLIMLIVAVIFVIGAFLCMDVPLDLPIPLSVLRIVYKVYPMVMIGLFIASFFAKKTEKD